MQDPCNFYVENDKERIEDAGIWFKMFFYLVFTNKK